MKKIFLIHFSLALLCMVVLPLQSYASVEYARQTGLECGECHIESIGGGPLTYKGEKFLDDLKTKGLYRPLSTIQKVVRLIIGYLHLMTAVIWFGTILYVHILLKPEYAAKGLPRGELALGWISIVLILVTGILLTVARVPSLKVFYTTRFGILLGIKIILFIIMLSSALIVTLYIGPRLKQKKRTAKKKDSGIYTAEDISNFDGKEGRSAFAAYNGRLYDVTKSPLWKSGTHLKKHEAGRDLTESLKTAPHGEEKILAMPEVGTLDFHKEGTDSRPFHVRLFFFFAYMNLVFTFLIIFVIALWRWW
jgi:predicted heme/steroid binding protein